LEVTTVEDFFDVLQAETARLLAPVLAHHAPAVISPGEDAHWTEQTALQLLDEHRALGRRPLELHHALRRSLLEALLLRLAHRADSADSPPAAPGDRRAVTYRRFLDLLELHFRRLHHVDEYARLLGCSTRTLTRAAQAAAGTGAREVIDERRLLEARRLLDSTDWTARAVAAHLGFPDTANFGRFFRNRTGQSPAAYAALNTARTAPHLDSASSRTGLAPEPQPPEHKSAACESWRLTRPSMSRRAPRELGPAAVFPSGRSTPAHSPTGRERPHNPHSLGSNPR
jgi:AraC-like DNA-binding protein